MDPSGFVVLGEYVPGIVQEIRYYSTYNFIGDRIDGYEEPVALCTIEAARALRWARFCVSAGRSRGGYGRVPSVSASCVMTVRAVLSTVRWSVS